MRSKRENCNFGTFIQEAEKEIKAGAEQILFAHFDRIVFTALHESNNSQHGMGASTELALVPVLDRPDQRTARTISRRAYMHKM